MYVLNILKCLNRVQNQFKHILSDSLPYCLTTLPSLPPQLAPYNSLLSDSLPYCLTPLLSLPPQPTPYHSLLPDSLPYCLTPLPALHHHPTPYPIYSPNSLPYCLSCKPGMQVSLCDRPKVVHSLISQSCTREHRDESLETLENWSKPEKEWVLIYYA